MKCLSMWNPWAVLMVIGAKKYETRDWGTLFRGTLLIHATKKFPRGAYELCFMEPFTQALRDGGYFHLDELMLPRGAIVGAVDVVDCFKTFWHQNTLIMSRGGRRDADAGVQPIPSSPELDFGDYSAGRHAIETTNPRVFETPIPYRGHQGRPFNVPDELVAEQLAKARAA